MADPEMPQGLDYETIHKAVAEVRRIIAQPDVAFRSLLVKISSPLDEFVGLLATLFYVSAFQAAGNRTLTQRERIDAIAADIGVLVREMEDIESSENIGTQVVAKVARERRSLAALRLRLERAAGSGPRQ